MTLDAEIEARLVDPETRRPLRKASGDQVSVIRARLADGSARRKDGESLEGELEGAYLDEAGRVAYPVVDGLATFLMDERIELEPPLGG